MGNSILDRPTKRGGRGSAKLCKPRFPVSDIVSKLICHKFSAKNIFIFFWEDFWPFFEEKNKKSPLSLKNHHFNEKNDKIDIFDWKVFVKLNAVSHFIQSPVFLP